MATEAAFLPFELPAASASSRESGFRPGILSGEQAASSFQSLQDVFGGTSKPEHASEGCRETKENIQPKVILKREGDRITAIQVFCACGRLIELDCVYA